MSVALLEGGKEIGEKISDVWSHPAMKIGIVLVSGGLLWVTWTSLTDVGTDWATPTSSDYPNTKDFNTYSPTQPATSVGSDEHTNEYEFGTHTVPTNTVPFVDGWADAVKTADAAFSGNEQVALAAFDATQDAKPTFNDALSNFMQQDPTYFSFQDYLKTKTQS